MFGFFEGTAIAKTPTAKMSAMKKDIHLLYCVSVAKNIKSSQILCSDNSKQKLWHSTYSVGLDTICKACALDYRAHALLLVQLTRIQHAPMSKYLANCILVGRNLRAGPALCGQPSASISGDVRQSKTDREQATNK